MCGRERSRRSRLREGAARVTTSKFRSSTHKETTLGQTIPPSQRSGARRRPSNRSTSTEGPVDDNRRSVIQSRRSLSSRRSQTDCVGGSTRTLARCGREVTRHWPQTRSRKTAADTVGRSYGSFCKWRTTGRSKSHRGSPSSFVHEPFVPQIPCFFQPSRIAALMETSDAHRIRAPRCDPNLAHFGLIFILAAKKLRMGKFSLAPPADRS